MREIVPTSEATPASPEAKPFPNQAVGILLALLAGAVVGLCLGLSPISPETGVFVGGCANISCLALVGFVAGQKISAREALWRVLCPPTRNKAESMLRPRSTVTKDRIKPWRTRHD
jgi:predicted lipid-binding transport protein (Tim44 family)